MEDQEHSFSPEVPENPDSLRPEELEAMRRMESDPLIINESHEDNTLRHLLAARELFFDKAAAKNNSDIEAQRGLRIINELIRARKSELGIDPPLEP